jgi:hypothetical protein
VVDLPKSQRRPSLRDRPRSVHASLLSGMAMVTAPDSFGLR